MPDSAPINREDLDALKREILEAIRASDERATERTRETETKLLAAFFSYQEHEKIQFARLKADTGNATRAAELRLDNIEQRVIELEKRFLMGRQ